MSISQKEELYITQNEYILFCDFLNRTPNQNIKLELFKVQDLIVDLINRPPSRYNILYQYFMELQLKLMRFGGVLWWDTCQWNSNSELVDISKNRHVEMLLTYTMERTNIIFYKNLS